MLQIVALANLLPEQSEVDELDSYMYQTVGHQLVDSYAVCTNLPLFRQHIHGTAKQAVSKPLMTLECSDCPCHICILSCIQRGQYDRL